MRRLIAVASGKGGIGKTWLTVTLAHALARLDRRVLLFDGDLGLANVDIQLGLGPERDLGTVLAGRCRLADAVQPYEPGGFDVLPGRSGSGRLAAVGAERIEELLNGLKGLAGGYDLVLLDLPAGVDSAVRRLFTAAEPRLVVTTDEPTALTDAYALVKVTKPAAVDGGFHVVVNFARSQAAGRQTFDGFCRVCARFLGVTPTLAGVVQHDPRVADAIRHQAPLLVRHPLSAAARDVETLARNLLVAP